MKDNILNIKVDSSNYINREINGKTFQNQAISQADKRQAKTNVALPSDDNVDEARDWVNHNKK